jgi:hypothetical protein
MKTFSEQRCGYRAIGKNHENSTAVDRLRNSFRFSDDRSGKVAHSKSFRRVLAEIGHSRFQSRPPPLSFWAAIKTRQLESCLRMLEPGLATTSRAKPAGV